MAKKSKAQRLRENRDVGAGTVRQGVKGKTTRKWNPKTARWEVIGAPRPSNSQTSSPKPKAKSVSSGTVTSAVAGSKPLTEKQKQMRKTGGFVRGTGVRKGQNNSDTKNRVANARSQNTTNAGRNAAAIAGLTVGPLVAGALGAGGGAAAAAGRTAIGAGGRAALPAGRKAIGASGRVVKSTAPRAPGKATLTDLRTATQRGVSSGQVPKAATTPKAITAGTKSQRSATWRSERDAVNTQAARSGVHPNTGGPATRAGNPAKVNRPARPTAAQRKKLAAQEASRPAKLAPGATRTSPVGNPRLNGQGRTGPKTQAQATAAKRAEAARKAAATRAKNKLSNMK